MSLSPLPVGSSSSSSNRGGGENLLVLAASGLGFVGLGFFIKIKVLVLTESCLDLNLFFIDQELLKSIFIEIILKGEDLKSRTFKIQTCKT